MTEPADTAARHRPAIDLRATGLAWALAVVVTAALVAATGYESPDPDSGLHAGIAARISELPLRLWIAPEWWGFWNSEGPYCEHPAGIFILPAALARLGFPPVQAAYAVNALYQAAFVLAALIAASVASPRDARALGWLLQFILVAFVYRIRANHEFALLAAILFAVYSTERARTRTAWTAGMIAGFCAVLLVKGVFAIVVPVTCALWLLARADGAGDLRARWKAWAAVAAMPLAGALVAWELRPPTSGRPAGLSWRSTRAGNCRRRPSPKGRSSAARPTRRPGMRRECSGTRCRSACLPDSWHGAA
jgi:hypothetical protein